MVLGSTEISTFWLGSAQVEKLYLGSDIVWESITWVVDSPFAFDVVSMPYFLHHANTQLTSGTVEATNIITDSIVEEATADSFDTSLFVAVGDILNVDGVSMVTTSVAETYSTPSDIVDSEAADVILLPTVTDTQATYMTDSGLYMFMSEGDIPDIQKYLLSIPGDISSATLLTTDDFSAEILTIGGIYISSDGLTLYILDSSRYTLHQYSLSSEFVLTSATHIGVSPTVVGIDGLLMGMAFSPDLMHVYFVGNQLGIPQHYIMAAGNVTTLELVSEGELFFGETAHSIGINNLGTRLYIGGESKYINEYILAEPYQISSMVLNTTFYVSGLNDLYNFVFYNGGTQFIANDNLGVFYQYAIDTTIDVTLTYTIDTTIATAGATPVNAYINENRAITDLFYQAQGETAYAGVSSDMTAFEVTFDLANMSIATVADTLETTTSLKDGDNLTIVTLDDAVHEIVASGVTETIVPTWKKVYGNLMIDQYSPVGFSISPDGTRMLTALTQTDYFVSYDLPVPFDISSAIETDRATPNGSPQSAGPLYTNETGSTVIMYDTAQDNLNSYSINNWGSANTFVFEDIQRRDGASISNDGLLLYQYPAGDNIYIYELTSAWNLATVSTSIVDNVDFLDFDNNIGSFSPSGNKFLIAEGVNAREYSLAIPFDIIDHTLINEITLTMAGPRQICYTSETSFIVASNDGFFRYDYVDEVHYSMDTSAVTAGEIPDRAYAEPKISMEVGKNNGYQEASSMSNIYDLTATPVLNVRQNYKNITAADSAFTYTFKTSLKSVGDKLLGLQGTLMKEEGN